MAGSGDAVAAVLEQWRARRPDLDLDGMAVFSRIYRLARLAELRRNALLEPHGLTVGDVDVLAPLWRAGGGLRPLELRRSQLIGSGTLTARLDRLERAGLLERRPDPEDRRGRTLFLTKEGKRLLPLLVEQLLEIENELLAVLPPTARARLSKDLARVLSAAEPA